MRYFIIALTAGLLISCQQAAKPHPVITAHVDAFNAGDIAAMGEVEHPDIEWLTIKDSTITVDVAGRETLAAVMTDYLANNPNVTGTLRDWSHNGDYVSVTETASWVSDDGTQISQSSLTVYQLENDLIRRVWYYPEVRE